MKQTREVGVKDFENHYENFDAGLLKLHPKNQIILHIMMQKIVCMLNLDWGRINFTLVVSEG